MKALTDYIKVIGNVLTKDVCEKIINTFETHQHGLYVTPVAKFDHMDLASIGLVNLSHGLCQTAVPYIRQYINERGMQEHIPIKGFEGVKLKKYEKNSDQLIKPHCDIWDKDTCVRYLNFIFYLNDNDGYTEFPHLDLKIKPKQGSLILFPPYWVFVHAAHNPTDYDKYIAISSLHYT